jgi:hypothetical protein
VSTPAPVPSGPAAPGGCEGIPVSELIRVDQFGYRPADGKVAVLTDPVEGWNKGQKLEPGAKYEVRAWADGAVALSGAPKVWNHGAVEKSSGDRGAWFDFSAVKTPGSYCVVDVERGVRSYRFDVRADVYKDVLRAAFKVFYFQRANVEKKKPYACVGDKCWLAAADYLGPQQDREARSVKERDNAKTARDLTGGWWDAGDVDKYVTFAGPPVHQLLSAYSERSCSSWAPSTTAILSQKNQRFRGFTTQIRARQPASPRPACLRTPRWCCRACRSSKRMRMVCKPARCAPGRRIKRCRIATPATTAPSRRATPTSH